MEAKKISDAVAAYFKDVIGKSGHVIGVEKIEKGWKVLFEAIDDRGAGFDPILGLYEVTVDEETNVTAYTRKSLRRRSDLEWHTAIE
jgi:hypothetical protein